MLLLGKFKIVGHSMEPQIKDGQPVLISSLPYWFKTPRINDIVAFEDNNDKVLVKRISKIQNGKYFFEGDNKNDSLDSRKLGSFSKSRIIGEIIFKL
jgi:phage repressor protein C with HTH and peptisase S24 domain